MSFIQRDQQRGLGQEREPIRRGGTLNRPVAFEGNRPMAGKFPIPPARGATPVATPVFRPINPILGGFKKGGTVKKTGAYQLHKGEKVVPVKGVRDVTSSSYDFRKKKR